MHRHALTLWSLTCALAISGCASTGEAVKTPRPECPQPQPPAPELMMEPSFEKQARVILFDSEPPATHGSEGSSE